MRIERIVDTIDSSMPGGHAQVLLDGLMLSDEHVLGAVDEGFRYAQVRLGNYQRIFDEGRRRVRAWEAAQVKK